MGIKRLTGNDQQPSNEFKKRIKHDRVLTHLLERIEELEQRLSGLDSKPNKSRKQRENDLDTK